MPQLFPGSGICRDLENGPLAVKCSIIVQANMCILISEGSNEFLQLKIPLYLHLKSKQEHFIVKNISVVIAIGMSSKLQ